MNVSVQSSKNKTGIGQDDSADRAGESAEAIAVVRVERGEVEAAREVEEVNGPVGEASGQVMVGDRQSPARLSSIIVVVVCWDVMEGGVVAAAEAEVGGGPVAVDELLPPRVADEVTNVPDVPGEVLPEKLGGRYGSPHRTHLHHVRSDIHTINKRLYLVRDLSSAL